MKLMIHAGLHKTATTTFQAICNRYAENMLAEKVCFPRMEQRGGHNWAVWELARGNPGPCEALIRECSSLVGEDGIAILSAEDLENCLIDVRTARQLEDIAFGNGVTAIDWFFVRRESLAYLESAYAELSKHGASLDFGQFSAAAENAGFTCCPSSTSNFLFFTRPERYIDSFRACVRGGVTLVDFAGFRDPFPGHVLLAPCLSASLLETMRGDHAMHNYWENRRARVAAVEFRYTCNFLGLDLAGLSRGARILLFGLLSPLVCRRIWNYTRHVKRLRARNDFAESR